MTAWYANILIEYQTNPLSQKQFLEGVTIAEYFPSGVSLRLLILL